MTNYRGLISRIPVKAPLTVPSRNWKLDWCRLPEDYRQFLKACNGAYVEYDVLATLANGDEESLSFSLYRLDLDEVYESNPFELEQLRTQPGFPAIGLLPIGRDGGASVLLLDLREGRQDVAHGCGLTCMDWPPPARQ